MILSIDPGINGCGCAVFMAGKLQNATYLKNTATTADDILTRSHDMAAAIARWAPKAFGTIVVEYPQIYAGPSSKNPNGLLMVATVAGAISTCIPAGSRVVSVLPREWKGSGSKALTEEFLRNRINARSDQPDVLEQIMGRIAKTYQNHVYDAIGIGWYYLTTQER